MLELEVELIEGHFNVETIRKLGVKALGLDSHIPIYS